MDVKADKLSRLEQQKAELERKIRAENKRIKDQQRKDDTRRKVVAGAVAIAHAERDPAFKGQLDELIARFVTRPQDRALFSLDPLPATENGPANDPAGTTGQAAG